MILKSLFDFIFPKRCVSCDEIISNESFLCVNCAVEIPFTHWNFDENNLIFEKINETTPIIAAYSLMYYFNKTVSKKLIYKLKYQNFEVLGNIFSELILPKISEFQLKNKIDGIVFVPIHEKKKKIRGYNQLDKLAFELGEKLAIPVYENALKTSKFQKSQTTKNKKSRFERRKNVFMNDKPLNPGTYLLLDDVFTSGATLINCIKELEKNENVKICVITIAFAK